MKKFAMFLALAALLVPFVIPTNVWAQEDSTPPLHDLIRQLQTGEAGGIPVSYAVDGRYQCEQLAGLPVKNDLFDFAFKVTDEVLPETIGYFDQKCLVKGIDGAAPKTGILKVYRFNEKSYMDASVALWSKTFPQQLMADSVDTSIELGYIRDMGLKYWMLTPYGLGGFPAARVSGELIPVTTVWVQWSTFSLRDESTWPLMPVLQAVETDQYYLLFSTGQIARISGIVCPKPNSEDLLTGQFDGSQINCGEENAFIFYKGRDDRYMPGIVIY